MSSLHGSRGAPFLQISSRLLTAFSAGVTTFVLISILTSNPSAAVRAAIPVPVSPVPVSPVPVSPDSMMATSPVTYTINDYDHRVHDAGGYDRPRTPNGFLANHGPWNANGAVITASSTCEAAYRCALALSYDLSAPGAEGGYWEELAYSYTSTWPLRDLRAFEQLRFRMRGDAIFGFAGQFELEFIGSDWGARATFPITGVTMAWQWKTVSLAPAGTIDWSRVKHLAVKLTGGSMTQKTGRLYFDDFVLVDLDDTDSLLDLIQRQTVRYFWDTRHPATGFARDRAVDPFYGRNATSVAAIGFELAAFGIGAEHGWLTRTDAASATHHILATLMAMPQGPAVSGTSGYRGFFYHFLNIDDAGGRWGESELSTIDTALLMAGVLFARQYYTGTGATETSIRGLASQLYDRVDWAWALRTDSLPADKTGQFHMAWKPDRRDCSDSGYTDCYEIPDTASGHGYFSGEWIAGTPPIARPTTWDYYTDEVLLINLLAIGSPTHGVPAATFSRWARVAGTYGDHTLVQSWFGQLFAHLIGQVWLDLRLAAEPNTGINWWRNSREAVLANRQFALDHRATCATYSPTRWGLSSSLGPPINPTSPGLDGIGLYTGYGALPRGDGAPATHDCTVTPHAVAASIQFLSRDPATNEAHQTLDDWCRHQPRLWGYYGLYDAFNLDQDWYARDYIGIDQGMALLGIENYRTGLVWDLLMRDLVLRSAMSAVFLWRAYVPVVLR